MQQIILHPEFKFNYTVLELLEYPISESISIEKCVDGVVYQHCDDIFVSDDFNKVFINDTHNGKLVINEFNYWNQDSEGHNLDFKGYHYVENNIHIVNKSADNNSVQIGCNKSGDHLAVSYMTNGDTTKLHLKVIDYNSAQGDNNYTEYDTTIYVEKDTEIIRSSMYCYKEAAFPYVAICLMTKKYGKYDLEIYIADINDGSDLKINKLNISNILTLNIELSKILNNFHDSDFDDDVNLSFQLTTVESVFVLGINVPGKNSIIVTGHLLNDRLITVREKVELAIGEYEEFGRDLKFFETSDILLYRKDSRYVKYTLPKGERFR